MEEDKKELQAIVSELKVIDEQLLNLMSKKKKLLKQKKRVEERLNPPAVQDLEIWNKTDFPWTKKVDEVKTTLFKVEHFRPLQHSAINVTMSGQDCIVIMPTGGGKSLCFQLPAFVSDGFTLVVSPLISLMEDQVMSLQRLGLDGVTLLSASTSTDKVKQIQESMTSEKRSLRLLYVTPEKLAKSKRFMSRLEKAHAAGLLKRIVIDEVHCCSQWGHDFRPDYKFLGVMKRQFPGVPILGLTATATQDVIDDVMKMLTIPSAVVLRAPLNRRNLFYEVLPKAPDTEQAMNEIYSLVTERFKGQSGIVYCLTQKDTEEVAKELCKRGLSASCYHANMDPASRSRVHTNWSNNRLQVVVATIAFGMGIDKPDVRFVIHHSISKSLENYYQESGRAGRDDGPAHCLLYANFADLFRQSTMVFTEQTGLDKLYAMAAYAFDLTRCRRHMIAHHFNEQRDTFECNEMCDHCSQKNADVSKCDITKYARSLVAILSHAKSSKDQRLTALKLVEAWLGKGGSPALRLAQHTAPSSVDRKQAERVIVHLLLNGYLREEFHFTPYSTISYLVPGDRSPFLDSPDHTVTMNVLVPSSAASCNKGGDTAAKRHVAKAQSSGKSSVSMPPTKKRKKLDDNGTDDVDNDVTVVSQRSHDASQSTDRVIVLDDDTL